MAEHRIEAITRHLATELGRRRFGVGAATSLVATMLLSRPALACKKVGKKCDKNKDCCDGARCKHGKCKCKSGWKDCDGDKKCERLNTDEHCGSCGNACTPVEGCCEGSSCIDLQDNNDHCGACGNACPNGTFCDTPACIPT